MGRLGAVLGLSWVALGGFWGCPGGSWGRLGRSWEGPGALGGTGAVELPPSLLRAQKKSLGPSRGRLGRSWGRLGANLGRLGPCWARLGASWASLGPSWGRLGAPWGGARGLLERGWSAIRANPSVYTKTYKNLRKINDFGGPGRVLGGSRGGLGASWGRLGGLLGSLGRVLGRLGSVLGPLEGVLGRLGASWRGPEADFVTPTALFEGLRPETLYFTRVWEGPRGKVHPRMTQKVGL